MTKQAIITLTISILGAVKILLDASGIHIISNEAINAVVNLVSAVVTVVGILHNHTAPAVSITSSEAEAISVDQV